MLAQRQAIYQGAAGNQPTAQQLRPLVATAEGWVKAVSASIREAPKMGFHDVPVEPKETGTRQIQATRENTHSCCEKLKSIVTKQELTALQLALASSAGDFIDTKTDHVEADLEHNKMFQNSLKKAFKGSTFDQETTY